MRYDFHIHSKFSYDSFLSPSSIIKISQKRKLDGVAITDHNTILGGLATQKENHDPSFEVIVGAEIKTEYGDIIGLFLNEEIKSRVFLEVIDEIHLQGGYSILPHPFRQYSNPELLVNYVDFIEAFNARSSFFENQKAKQFANKFKKKYTAGSDAHSSIEIGRGVCDIDSRQNSNFPNIVSFGGKETNFILSHGISYSTELIKKLLS